MLHSDRERALIALIKGPADPQDVGGGKGRCQASRVLATSCMSGAQREARAATPGRKARLVTMSRGIRSASVHLVRVAVVILQGKHAEVGVYS